MNYYKARQRESDGRWDYTCRNNDWVTPVGYCKLFAEWNDNSIGMMYGAGPEGREYYERYIQPFRETAHKSHDTGHATEEEARECYRRYLLDHHTRLDGKYSDTQRKCKECGDWTSGYAEVDHQHFDLCDEHRTLEVVEKLFPKVGDICCS